MTEKAKKKFLKTASLYYLLLLVFAPYHRRTIVDATIIEAPSSTKI